MWNKFYLARNLINNYIFIELVKSLNCRTEPSLVDLEVTLKNELYIELVKKIVFLPFQGVQLN